MPNNQSRRVLFLAVCGLEFVPGLMGFQSAKAAVIPNLVVNEVFAGGGNAGAPYQNDFVELFNKGTVSQSLSGLILDYINTGGTTTNITNFTNGTTSTILAGQHLLITGASGTNGTPLVGMFTSSANLAVTGGSVKLWDGTSSTDLVGWGTASSQFEGTGPAAAMANTTSIQRFTPDGKDTGTNSADFILFGPTPGAANVPEPAAVGLLGFAAMAALARRPKQQKA